MCLCAFRCLCAQKSEIVLIKSNDIDVCSKTNIMNKLIETSKGSEKTKNNKRRKDIDSERENPKKIILCF